MKREEKYVEFKLNFYKQTYKQTDKQADMVLKVSTPEVGHLNTGTGTKIRNKKSLNQTQLI